MSSSIRDLDPRPEAADRFDELYRQWYRPVVRLCRRYLGHHGDAEAVAQDAFIRAWASWDTFLDARPFGPWVCTIARRLCLNELRDSARRHSRAERAGFCATPRLVVDDHIDTVLQADAVSTVFERLPARDRRLVVLRDVDGWSYDDIARIEGVTVESVRGALKRARSGFRRLYEQVAPGRWVGLPVLLRRRLARLFEEASRGPAFLFGGGDLVVPALVATLLLAPTPHAGAAAGDPSGRPAATAEAPGLAAPPTSPAPVEPAVPRRTAGAPAAAGPTPATDPAPAAAPADAPTPDAGGDYQFTPSPSYAEDGTVFAAGRRRNCPGVDCALLFKSTDGGATWAAVPASGREVGRILLPPSWPADPRLFSVSATALSMSKDGGRSFERVTAAPGPASMSPLFSAGDPRIFFVTGVHNKSLALEYHDEEKVLRPARVPLPLTATPLSIAFSGDYAISGRLFVSVVEVGHGRLPSKASSQVVLYESVRRVYSCGPTECRPVLDLDRPGDPTVVWSPGRADTAFVWSPFEILRSRDGGASFEHLGPLPGTGAHRMVRNLVAGRDGRLFATMTPDTGTSSDRLYVSDDDGATWSVVSTGTEQFVNVTPLPDGSLLAARPAKAGGGILRFQS